MEGRRLALVFREEDMEGNCRKEDVEREDQPMKCPSEYEIIVYVQLVQTLSKIALVD